MLVDQIENDDEEEEEDEQPRAKGRFFNSSAKFEKKSMIDSE